MGALDKPRRWRIESTAGVVPGVYPGAGELEALDVMARDAGYADYRASCEVTGEDPETWAERLIVVEVPNA